MLEIEATSTSNRGEAAHLTTSSAAGSGESLPFVPSPARKASWDLAERLDELALTLSTSMMVVIVINIIIVDVFMELNSNNYILEKYVNGTIYVYF
ncbi:hypothetical protein ElyMa_003832700 [Elysia marginata]|uniref:Ion transport domain-containing protein n=1 Tax=Elysia marginata TaxID=1093978 RepID=A0AAV4FGJ9_9GAST|nr:hypothetical protein ElyMa_003832700 [Elysia marginata]